jgi:hypothetical protein
LFDQERELETKDLVRFADEMLAIIASPETAPRKLVMLEKHLSESEVSLGRSGLVQGRGQRGR